MSQIKVLPKVIIDQIKAGEVVEGPYNVLKELMENSIDSGATRLSIAIRDNGLGKIVVEDNGQGMGLSDLKLAFKRHATSKLRNLNDFETLNTFGFRGEALSSISSVSKGLCLSNFKNSCHQVKWVGSNFSSIEEGYRSEIGTTIIINDLFFNTPVRLKFLKKGQSEINNIIKTLNCYLLIYKNIDFHITINDEEKKIYPRCSNESDFNKRVNKVFNNKDKKISILGHYENIKISGMFFIKKSPSRRKNKQLIFVNRRPIEHKKIHQCIFRNFEHLFGALGIEYFIKIDISPEDIDVNVHPRKTEIRFFNEPRIYSLISTLIKEQVVETNVRPKLKEENKIIELFPIETFFLLKFNCKSFLINCFLLFEDYIKEFTHSVHFIELLIPLEVEEKSTISELFKYQYQNKKLFLTSVEKNIFDLPFYDYFKKIKEKRMTSNSLEKHQTILINHIKKKGFDTLCKKNIMIPFNQQNLESFFEKEIDNCNRPNLHGQI